MVLLISPSWSQVGSHSSRQHIYFQSTRREWSLSSILASFNKEKLSPKNPSKSFLLPGQTLLHSYLCLSNNPRKWGFLRLHGEGKYGSRKSGWRALDLTSAESAIAFPSLFFFSTSFFHLRSIRLIHIYYMFFVLGSLWGMKSLPWDADKSWQCLIVRIVIEVGEEKVRGAFMEKSSPSSCTFSLPSSSISNTQVLPILFFKFEQLFNCLKYT